MPIALGLEVISMTLNQALQVISSLGPIATATAAIVALVVGTITIHQRTWADRREHWWKRAQWSLELVMSNDPLEQRVGVNALNYLSKSELTKQDEALMLSAAIDAFMEEKDSEIGGDDE
jgi:hypothetical protein